MQFKYNKEPKHDFLSIKDSIVSINDIAYILKKDKDYEIQVAFKNGRQFDVEFKDQDELKSHWTQIINLLC